MHRFADAHSKIRQVNEVFVSLLKCIRVDIVHCVRPNFLKEQKSAGDEWQIIRRRVLRIGQAVLV